MKKLKIWIKAYLEKRNKKHLLYIPFGVQIWNWFHQKVIGINRSTSTSVYYTSKVAGYKNIILPEKNTTSIKISFAVSGGAYIRVFDGTTLQIGEGTLWAFNFCVVTGNHGLIDRSDYSYKSVIIGKNCWIGNRVTILPGVELGDNITIGANTVVTKSFPSNVVIAGNPARIIKEVFVEGNVAARSSELAT